MTECSGFISSFYSGSTVDGPNLRYVLFLSKCNLTCPFCHNVDICFKNGTEYSVTEILNKTKRILPYIKKGGVTLSGGEPFLQAIFVEELLKKFNELNINTCIETNGSIVNDEIIKRTNLLIIDVKNQFENNIDYSLILKKASLFNVEVELSCVIIEGVNDDFKSLDKLKELARLYNVRNIKLLPFSKICKSKYEELNKLFQYENFNETSIKTIEKLNNYLK